VAAADIVLLPAMALQRTEAGFGFADAMVEHASAGRSA